MAALKGKKSRKKQEAYEDVVEIHSRDGQENSVESQDSPHQEVDEQYGAGEDSEEKLQCLEREKEQLQDRLLRTMAEFDNYKKRVVREKEDLIAHGTEKFALELLPVIDNLERAIDQARQAEGIEPVVEGIEMILKQFLTTLEKFHIKSFLSAGEPFDPEKHEAMVQQEHDEIEENIIIDEYLKGYMLRDKLLRPARVVVSGGPPKQDSPEEDE